MYAGLLTAYLNCLLNSGLLAVTRLRSSTGVCVCVCVCVCIRKGGRRGDNHMY